MSRLILNSEKSRIMALNEKTPICRRGLSEYSHKTKTVMCLHFMRALQLLQQQIKENA